MHFKKQFMSGVSRSLSLANIAYVDIFLQETLCVNDLLRLLLLEKATCVIVSTSFQSFLFYSSITCHTKTYEHAQAMH